MSQRKTERNDALYADREAGMNWTQLAKKYGLARTTVPIIYRRTRERLLFGHGDLTPEERSRIGRKHMPVMWANMSPETRERHREKARATGAARWRKRWAAMTDAEREARIEKLREGQRQYWGAWRFQRQQAKKRESGTARS